MPPRDPRPGFLATQQGFTPVFSVLEIIDGDIIPAPPIQPGYGLYDNGGVLCLTMAAALDWPDADPAIPGALWSNGWVVTASLPTSPPAGVAPVYWNQTNAISLLAQGANAITTIEPLIGPGTGQIWVNLAMGGEVWVVPPAQGQGLYNDGGVLTLVDDAFDGWPDSDPEIPGALWSNGGVITASLPTSPPVAPTPIYWDATTSSLLLSAGANVITTTQPPAGSKEIWINLAMGGEAWVA